MKVTAHESNAVYICDYCRRRKDEIVLQFRTEHLPNRSRYAFEIHESCLLAIVEQAKLNLKGGDSKCQYETGANEA